MASRKLASKNADANVHHAGLGGRLGSASDLKTIDPSSLVTSKNNCSLVWLPITRLINHPGQWQDTRTSAGIDPKTLTWDKGEPNGLLNKEDCVAASLNKYLAFTFKIGLGMICCSLVSWPWLEEFNALDMESNPDPCPCTWRLWDDTLFGESNPGSCLKERPLLAFTRTTRPMALYFPLSKGMWIYEPFKSLPGLKWCLTFTFRYTHTCYLRGSFFISCSALA